MPAEPAKPLLHLVFGGELLNLDEVEFKDLSELDIVHMHRLLDPDENRQAGAR
jgi:hypothetical protein